MMSKEEPEILSKIYNMIRDTFHSQSGVFLDKRQCFEIATIILDNINQNKDE